MVLVCRVHLSVVSVCRVYLCGVGVPCVSVCRVCVPCVSVWCWCALCICVWVHSLGLFNAESPPERYRLCPSHGAAAVVSQSPRAGAAGHLRTKDAGQR